MLYGSRDGAGSASVARQTYAFVSHPKDAATGWWTVLRARTGRWPAARPRVCRRLLAISQDGPFADRGNKEARLGFVVSSLSASKEASQEFGAVKSHEASSWPHAASSLLADARLAGVIDG